MPIQAIAIPEDYLCSITGELMIDPVFTADGETYERTVIADWLQTHDTSPNTNDVLEHKQLVPNRKLKSQISEFVEKNRKAFEHELLAAAKKGELEVVKHSLKLGISVNAEDQNGLTALYYVLQQGHSDLASLLIESGASYQEPMKVPVANVAPASQVKAVSYNELAQVRNQIYSHEYQLRELEEAAKKELALRENLHRDMLYQIKNQLAQMQVHAHMITEYGNINWIIKPVSIDLNCAFSVYLPEHIDTSRISAQRDEIRSQLGSTARSKLSPQEVQALQDRYAFLNLAPDYLRARAHYYDLADLVQELKQKSQQTNNAQTWELNNLRQRILELSRPNLPATQALVTKLRAQVAALEKFSSAEAMLPNPKSLQIQQELAALRRQEAELDQALQRQQQAQQRQQDEAARPLREKQAKLEEVKQKKTALEQKLVDTPSYLEGMRNWLKQFCSTQEVARWNQIRQLEQECAMLNSQTRPTTNTGYIPNPVQAPKIAGRNQLITKLKTTEVWQLQRVFTEVALYHEQEKLAEASEKVKQGQENPNNIRIYEERIAAYSRQLNEKNEILQRVEYCQAQIPLLQEQINQLELEIKPYQTQVEALSAEIQQLQQPRSASPAQPPLQNAPHYTTALHLAALHGHKALIQLLLAKGMPVDGTDAEGQTALHCAAKLKKPELVKLLLEQGATLSCQDKKGNTPLHIAAQQNDEATIEFLLEQGANPYAKNQQGIRPLDLGQKALLASKLEALTNKQMQAMQGQIHTLQQQLQQLQLQMQQLLVQPPAPAASSSGYLSFVPASAASSEALAAEPIYPSQPSAAVSSQQSTRPKFFKPAANESKLDQDLDALSEQVNLKREVGYHHEAIKLSQQKVDRIRQEIEKPANENIHKGKLYAKLAHADFDHACLLQEAGRLKDALFYLGKAEEICKRSASLTRLAQQVAQKLEECRITPKTASASFSVAQK